MSACKNHIILIDDEEATLFFHTLMVEEADVCDNIIGLRSGNELLSTLKDIYSKTPYTLSLIFLDINMPATDGWETLDEIALLEKSIQSQLHIYMASASEHPKDKEKCMQHSMVKDLIPKPITPEKVKCLYEQMLN